MRLVIAQGAVTDVDGHPWEWQLQGPSDSDSPRAAGAPRFLLVLNTPDDADHWAYGESGPEFDVSALFDALTLRAFTALRIDT